MPYICHLLTPCGIKADPTKVEAICNMPQPSDVHGVKQIMGMVNYLARFLPKLSDVTKPLRQLTRKDVPFVCTVQRDKVFAELKKLVTEPSLLKYYDPNENLVLQSNASKKGLGAVLLQGGTPSKDAHAPTALRC